MYIYIILCIYNNCNTACNNKCHEMLLDVVKLI